MKEIQKIYITDGGYVLLKDVDGQYHSLETFTEVDTREIVIRAFQNK